MKNILKKYWRSILLFIIIGLVLIPFLIHLFFKINSCCEFFIAEWTAGDVLAFYGVLLGSVATVWGVYLSIQFSRSNYEDDTKRKVLPFIVLTTLKVKVKYNPLAMQDIRKETVKKDTYEEVLLNEVYFILSNDKIEVKTTLTAQQEQNIHQGGARWINGENGSKSLVATDLLSLPMVIENVGNGVANLFRVGLNSNSIAEDDWKYVTPMPFKVGQTLYIHIYSEDAKLSLGEYSLDLVYEDIYKNQYRQRYTIEIGEKDNQVYASLDCNGQQESIKNDQ